MDFTFILNSVLFGIGLAMDAFSVSLANGLNEPGMSLKRESQIAGVFSFFQFIMPLAGWFCVRTVQNEFSAFHRYIPWIALILLLIIGGNMIREGISHRESDSEKTAVGTGSLLLQGIATSIDALSVGFTISDVDGLEAVTEALIIGILTFFICLLGLKLGKKIGTRLAGKASVLGGVLLIIIGIEIFIKGIAS